MDGAASALKVGLVAPGAPRRLPGRLQEVESLQQARRRLSLFRPYAALDLGDVDASDGERMAAGHEAQQKLGDFLIAAQMGDQDRRVEQVGAQALDSVRRVFLTQEAVEPRSPQ